MNTKTVGLTKEEAQAIIKVLTEGMPDGQRKRDFLAKIWYKLHCFVTKK